MLCITYDVAYEYNIPALDGEEYSIVVSSEENASCKLVYEIIVNIFSKNE